MLLRHGSVWLLVGLVGLSGGRAAAQSDEDDGDDDAPPERSPEPPPEPVPPEPVPPQPAPDAPDAHARAKALGAAAARADIERERVRQLEARKVPPPPPPPPPDMSFIAGADVVYAPGPDGDPVLADVHLAFTSRTLELGYVELWSVLPWLPIADSQGQEYGLTQACYLCASLGLRLAQIAPEAYLTFAFDYHWVYIGAGGEDDFKTPAAGGELGVMAGDDGWSVIGRLTLQALLLDGYAGARGALDVSGWLNVAGPLAVYGRFAYVSGSFDGVDGGAGYSFGGPIVQLGLGWAP